MSSFLSDMGKSFSKYLPSIGNNIVGGMERRRKKEDAIIQKQQEDAEAKAKLEESRQYARSEELRKKNETKAEKQAENEASQKALQSLISGEKTVSNPKFTTPKMTESGEEYNDPIKLNVPLTDVDKIRLEGELTAKNSKSYGDYQKKLEDEKKAKEVKYSEINGIKIGRTPKGEVVSQEPIPLKEQTYEYISKDDSPNMFKKYANGITERTNMPNPAYDKNKNGKVTSKTANEFMKVGAEIGSLAYSYTKDKIELENDPKYLEYKNEYGDKALQKWYEKDENGYKAYVDQKTKLDAKIKSLQEKRGSSISILRAATDDPSGFNFGSTDTNIQKLITSGKRDLATTAILEVFIDLAKKGKVSPNDMNLIAPYVQLQTGVDPRTVEGFDKLYNSIVESIKE